jgi:hypothetical protein
MARSSILGTQISNAQNAHNAHNAPNAHSLGGGLSQLAP